MNKKIISMLLATAVTLTCMGCVSSENTKTSDTKSTASISESVQAPVEVIVFAAASMTETLDKVIESYKAVAPNVTITPSYDSSGTLKTQIEEGAVCDLFISAAQKQMNLLDAASPKNEGLDFILSDTRVNFLENEVVLVVPKGNKADIKTFADLGTDKLTLLCIGNEDVPVGAYSEEILTKLNIFDSLKSESKLTYGSNVKEVTTQVAEGTVDAGIIYATDAFSAKLTAVDKATPDMCRQVVYPVAVLKNAPNQQAAKDFLKYLQSKEAMGIFESVGFAPVA